MKSVEVNICSPLRRRRSTSTTNRRHKSEYRSIPYMKEKGREDFRSQPCFNHSRILAEISVSLGHHVSAIKTTER